MQKNLKREAIFKKIIFKNSKGTIKNYLFIKYLVDAGLVYAGNRYKGLTLEMHLNTKK